jgi:hypothetical protein
MFWILGERNNSIGVAEKVKREEIPIGIKADGSKTKSETEARRKHRITKLYALRRSLRSLLGPRPCLQHGLFAAYGVKGHIGVRPGWPHPYVAYNQNVMRHTPKIFYIKNKKNVVILFDVKKGIKNN